MFIILGEAPYSPEDTTMAKAILKKAGCNTSGDALDGLNGWAYWLLEQAAKRAKANGRKTVRSHDFINM
jgi:histone H3/H4